MQLEVTDESEMAEKVGPGVSLCCNCNCNFTIFG